MLNYIYVYVNNSWTDRANELYMQVKEEGGSWAHLKNARELMLVKDALFHDYDRVIIDLPANDTGIACAEILKDKLYNLSWTAHYAGNGYHDYMDLIREVMKI